MAVNKLDELKVEEGVAALLKLFENRQNNSKSLLTGAEQVYLQVDFVKIPRMRKTVIRIPLPNSLLTETSDVCLIVADIKRGRNVPHEMTISHYKKLLDKKGITDEQKVTILPSRQLRVEYGPYEARKKLCNMFESFLIDNKLSNFLFPKLGKEFTKSRKWPIPIRIKRKNLKDEILSKMKKTSLLLDGTGTTKTMQIGHLGMTSKEITENIVSTGFYIMKYFPGGWNNIRSLHIKGQRTAAVPIYLSLISPNDVPIPRIRGKRKKSVLAVGEVSSIGRKVTVRRTGDVIVHDVSSDEDSENEYQTDESDDEEDLRIHAKKVIPSKRKQPDENEEETEKATEEASSDEDDNKAEDDIETGYLFRMQKEEEELKKREAENESQKTEKDTSQPAESQQSKKKRKPEFSAKKEVQNNQAKKKKLSRSR